MGQKLKVLIVDDETFTRQLVQNALLQQGFEVSSCESASQAMVLVRQEEPHVVVSDLDLGKGPTGVDLLNLLSREYPWIGLVTMSAHSAPELVGGGRIPEGVPYLVKSQINDLQEIGSAIRKSIFNLAPDVFALQEKQNADTDEVLFVSTRQAEILRMLAQGLSNQAISEARGTSLRAVETMIQRMYQGLGLSRKSGLNNRVEAVSLWHQGKIQVR